jgi:hypothetical protein
MKVQDCDDLISCIMISVADIQSQHHSLHSDICVKYNVKSKMKTASNFGIISFLSF